MQARRLISSCVVLLAVLGGCSDGNPEEKRQLQQEIAQLRQQLVSRRAERSAEIAYHERQAGISAGCDWLVPLCPDAIAEPGREAQAGGFAGGSSFPFWMIVLLKVLIAATGFGWLIITLSFGFDWFLRPSRAQTKEARELVERARADAIRITAAAENKLLATNQSIHEAREELANLNSAITKIRDELAHHEDLLGRRQQNLAAVEEARRALDPI